MVEDTIITFVDCDNSISTFGTQPLQPEVTPTGPETFYVYENDDGTNSFVRVAAGKLPPRWSRSSTRPIKVDRLPEPFETWDREKDCWVKNDAGHADFQCGQKHIEQAHIVKFIEAKLISCGISNPDFLLVREAEMLGLPINELAANVINKQQEFAEAELQRRKIKSSKIKE